MTVEGSPDVDHYYAHDHLFSVVALIADDGSIEERYIYDAYGKMTRLDPDFSSWSGTPVGNPYYFTGQRLDNLDSNSLLIMYYKNRYYLTDIGRFIQRDPIGIRDGICIVYFHKTGTPLIPFPIQTTRQYGDGMNLYEYISCNPIILNDSKGLTLASQCQDYCIDRVSPIHAAARLMACQGCCDKTADSASKKRISAKQLGALCVNFANHIPDAYSLIGGGQITTIGDIEKALETILELQQKKREKCPSLQCCTDEVFRNLLNNINTGCGREFDFGYGSPEKCNDNDNAIKLMWKVLKNASCCRAKSLYIKICSPDNDDRKSVIDEYVSEHDKCNHILSNKPFYNVIDMLFPRLMALYNKAGNCTPCD